MMRKQETPTIRLQAKMPKNGKTQKLSSRKGWNHAMFSNGFRYFVNQFSDAETPYLYTTCSAEGKTLSTLMDNGRLKERLSTLQLPKKEFFTFTTSDSLQLPKKEFFTFTTSEGVKLNGVMIKPVNFNASKKYPVIMWQYSGPGSQQVKNSWTIGSMGSGAMFDNYLRQKIRWKQLFIWARFLMSIKKTSVYGDGAMVASVR